MKSVGRSDALLRLALLTLLIGGVAAFPPQRQAQRNPAINVTTANTDVAELQRQFQTPPDDSRIMMRWWWYGPAVTNAELEREMRLMKEGGIGGFEVQPVYPVAMDDDAAGIKNLPFLSDEFIQALRFTADKSHELGLRMDLTLGSGWPFGGPMVPIGQAAGRLRVERIKLTDGKRRVPMPSLTEGEKLVAIFLANAQGQSINDSREITATAEMRQNAVHLPADLNGANEVQFYISSRTGQQVKRASVGAEGFVLDHYDRTAIDHYLKSVGDRLMQAFGSNRPHALFCDSLELFGSDWTPDYLAEFQKRRGYDLKPYLPALVGNIGPQTASIRHDWGQTLTELLNDRFLTPMRDWTKRNNTKFRIQGYGIPPMTLSGNALADLPEGEGAQWKVVRASRWASSASHLYGRNVTSSETWTWLHSPSFRATPLDVKAEADLHFVQGINQLIGHGWPYTAPGVEYPGWRFYAAAVFNEKNPWWIAMPDLARYLQRVSFLMRQGQPANDVALYLPNDDAWASFTGGHVHMIETLRDQVGPNLMPAILEAGYNLDFFDDDALRQLGKVDKTALVMGTNKYKAVVLPNVERIPFDTLKKLEEFANAGGTVIATGRIPSIAPGFKATEAEHRQIRELAQRLFEGSSAKAHFVKDEKLELGGKLASLVQPDLALSPAVADIGFIRRHTENAEIYFIANSSNQPQNVKATFRVQGMNAELWNPLDGSAVAASAQAEENSVSLALNLEPYGSRVVVFTKRSLPKLPTKSQTADTIDLSEKWRMVFPERYAINANSLRSWTDSEETRFFSGQVRYEKEVLVSEAMLRKTAELILDFGEGQPVTPRPLKNGSRAWLDAPIRDAAVIYVNGNRAGSLWCPPYCLNITKLVKPGKNEFQIVVGNTAINYLAGHRLPDYRLLNLKYGLRFEPQDMENVQPLPSGLLGTVRLIVNAR